MFKERENHKNTKEFKKKLNPPTTHSYSFWFNSNVFLS